jgi:hypothetical protein
MGLKYEMEQRLILANAFGGTFVFFANAQTNAKKIQKSHQANAPKTPQTMDNRATTDRTPTPNSTYKKLAAQW